VNTRATSNVAVRHAGQAVLYGLFAAAIGYFSTSPVYTHLQPDEALLKVSFTHAAQRVGECRQRSDEELARLPPNMRIREDCPRERAPVRVEVDFDGQTRYIETLQPTGLSRDGAASVYRRFTVPAGEYRVAARLSDRADGVFTHRAEQTIRLAPADILVVEFHGGAGGFRFLYPASGAQLDRD
jgi:hypothetical protein